MKKIVITFFSLFAFAFIANSEIICWTSPCNTGECAFIYPGDSPQDIADLIALANNDSCGPQTAESTIQP